MSLGPATSEAPIDRRQRHTLRGFDPDAFNEAAEAISYCETLDRWPAVLKADGLAAGKGVVIAQEPRTAVAAVRDIMLNRRYGEAGARLVIEDFLVGEELSMTALVDGETIAILESSRDHKAAFDGDTGPNTGGMGAFSPSRLLTPRLYEQIEERVLIPVVHAMARSGAPYRGLLYAGLMITTEGPMVLEFNVRGGDPEMEVVLPRLESDAVELFLAAATGRLAEVEEIRWSPKVACGVVLADGGYPESTTPGLPIEGVQEAAALPDVKVFHAGTRLVDGRLVTAGGRVLCVTGLGDDLAAARERAYQGVRRIRFEGMRYRTDIGWRELSGAPEVASRP